MSVTQIPSTSSCQTMNNIRNILKKTDDKVDEILQTYTTNQHFRGLILENKQKISNYIFGVLSSPLTIINQIPNCCDLHSLIISNLFVFRSKSLAEQVNQNLQEKVAKSSKLSFNVSFFCC